MTIFRLLFIALAAASIIAPPAGAADPTPDSRRLAAELPLADMHMHLYRGLTPAQLKDRMDRNNIRWAGAVGPVMPGIDPRPFIELLGGRYIPMAGQPEVHSVFSSRGAAALADAENSVFAAMIARADDLFRSGHIRGFGELILNNKASNPQPSLRRKAAIDSPFTRKMFEIAARNNGVIQIHTEDDEDSLSGLEALMKTYPTVPVILSHCLVVTKDTSMPERMLKSSPLVHCDLSARSASGKGRADRRIFGPDFVEPQWLRLIEAYPDRFVVGSDATDDKVDFDKVIGDIRNGLLPRLPARAARKVAHENAQKLFGLTL